MAPDRALAFSRRRFAMPLVEAYRETSAFPVGTPEAVRVEHCASGRPAVSVLGAKGPSASS